MEDKSIIRAFEVPPDDVDLPVEERREYKNCVYTLTLSDGKERFRGKLFFVVVADENDVGKCVVSLSMPGLTAAEGVMFLRHVNISITEMTLESVDGTVKVIDDLLKDEGDQDKA